MKKIFILLVFCICMGISCKKESADTKKKIEDIQKNTKISKYILDNSNIEIIPIQHGSFILKNKKLIFYFDPVGKIDYYSEMEKPDFIIITDIHPDHLDWRLVSKIKTSQTKIIAPSSVEKLLNTNGINDVLVMKNDEIKSYDAFQIKAIPMYNTTKDRLKMHEKGRGNGYLLEMDGKRIYISGDTEDIKEMRELKNIDFALVCMNLPYTMSIDQAASGVLAFSPKVVMPYHYRSKDKLSDIEKFKQIVSKNKNIKVELLNWYP